MKSSISKNIKKHLNILSLIMFLCIVILFILKDNLNSILYPIGISIFLFSILITYFTLGIKHDKKNHIKFKMNNTIIVISIFYIITIYLIGNITGFHENILDISKGIYIIIYAIVSEIFRYIVISKSSKTTNIQYTITFLYVLIDVLLLSNFSLSNPIPIFDILSITFISILTNSLTSYISYKYGYKTSLIYRGITFVFPSIAPLYPKLGNYINVIANLTFASITFYNISKPTRKEDEENISFKKNFFFYLERVLLVFIFIIICLVSGKFTYQISAIASDSMYPNLKKGDAIITKKLNDKERSKLKPGMIVSFKDGDKIITHRILEIVKEKGEEYIITKGDNNERKDIQKKKKDAIISIVRFRIPYVGYPSIEVSEIKNNREEYR